MHFEPVKIPAFTCDPPSPVFALIPTASRDTDVITDSYRKGIHRIDVILVLGLRGFREMLKERLKQRCDAMESPIISGVNDPGQKAKVP